MVSYRMTLSPGLPGPGLSLPRQLFLLRYFTRAVASVPGVTGTEQFLFLIYKGGYLRSSKELLGHIHGPRVISFERRKVQLPQVKTLLFIGGRLRDKVVLLSVRITAIRPLHFV
jgi:hypothetical protein